MKNKTVYVYLMMNKLNTVIYTGVTSNLKRRVFNHREKSIKGYTSKYNVSKLVYYEIFSDIRNAIKREKQIKGGSRKKKLALIASINPDFRDLYKDI